MPTPGPYPGPQTAPLLISFESAEEAAVAQVTKPQ